MKPFNSKHSLNSAVWRCWNPGEQSCYFCLRDKISKLECYNQHVALLKLPDLHGDSVGVCARPVVLEGVEQLGQQTERHHYRPGHSTVTGEHILQPQIPSTAHKHFSSSLLLVILVTGKLSNENITHHSPIHTFDNELDYDGAFRSALTWLKASCTCTHEPCTFTHSCPTQIHIICLLGVWTNPPLGVHKGCTFRMWGPYGLLCTNDGDGNFWWQMHTYVYTSTH